MQSDTDIAEFVRERDVAMETDDIFWAAKMLPDASSPNVVEIAFHKARMQTLSVSENKRRESLKWLADRGLNDLMGAPVRHNDPLPT